MARIRTATGAEDRWTQAPRPAKMRTPRGKSPMTCRRNLPRERLALFASLFSALLGACLDEEVVKCADGRICPASLRCDAAHQGCVLPQQLESCVNKQQGESCSYRGVPVGACYEQVCLPSGCGNGILDTSEVCDDSNRFHGDGCSADCRSNESCGNQFVDVTVGEQC